MLRNSNPEPSLALGSDFGPHRLIDLIAVGGMAEIYLAETKGIAGFNKRLALKVILPEFAGDAQFVQMLINEAKLAVGLTHPNIVQTFDLGRIADLYFIAMEYVDGADFFQLLRWLSERGEQIPIPAALYVAREMMGGLEYAHNKRDGNGVPLRIIHRDVSPQNVLVSRGGSVKLVDFGIAKAANLSNRTRTGVIKGKLVYMSPEQAWGEAIDQRSDLYSAGVVLYEALTGGSLYTEQHPVKLLQLVRKAEIQQPSRLRYDIDEELDEIVMGALAAKPDERYQTAREFADNIDDYLRRNHPDYGAAELGSLVATLLDEPRKQEPSASQPGSEPRSGSEPLADESSLMERKDFELNQHSMIFSAEEMGVSEIRGEGAASAGGAKLVLLSDDGNETFELGEQFVIGRGGDLRLPDARVSRRHARIVLHEGVHLLEDLKSSNGTYLNDERLDDLRALENGDRIRIGPFHMQFLFEPRSQESAAPPAAAGSYPPAPAGSYPPAPAARATPAAPAAHPPAPGASAPPMGVPGLPERPRVQGADSASQVSAEPSVSGGMPGVGDSAAYPPAAGMPGTGDSAAYEPAAAAAAVAGRPNSGAIEQAIGCLTAQLGEETLTLPIEGGVSLGQQLAVGELELAVAGGRIVRRDGGYWLEPLDGQRALLVNGEALAGPHRLAAGDRVTVGPLQMLFTLR